MVKLPEVVGIERGKIDGVSVVKQMYADGSYGVDAGNGSVDMYYQDGTIRKFEKIGNDDYYLSEEKLPNGEEREWDAKGNKLHEKLPNGEEREWTVVNGKVYLKEENIPGVSRKEYKVTGKRTRLGRNGRSIIPGTEEHRLMAETFADGSSKEYGYGGKVIAEKFSDGSTKEYDYEGILKAERLADGTTKDYDSFGRLSAENFPDGTWKKYGVHVSETTTSRLVGGYHSGKGSMHRHVKHYLREECLPNGDVKAYYHSGNVERFTSKDGKTEQTFYEDGTKKTEKLPKGSYKEWDSEGRITHEKRADATLVDYKYDDNGNVVYHAVNGKEDTVKYLAMKRVAERQAEKSEKLRKQNQGIENAQQTVKKLNPLQKAVEMTKAKIAVKRELSGR